MIIESSRFGAFEYTETDVVMFPNGIPGFKTYKKYIFIEIEESPFVYMQSIEDGDITFIVVSPFDFYREYEFEIPEHIRSEMKLNDQKMIKVYSIVSIREKLANATMNLTAPLIINNTNRTGMQYILSDGVYSVRHPLFSNSSKGGK